jgi:hypothetical protein
MVQSPTPSPTVELVVRRTLTGATSLYGVASVAVAVLDSDLVVVAATPVVVAVSGRRPDKVVAVDHTTTDLTR